MKPCLNFISVLGLLIVGGCASYHPSASKASADAQANYVTQSSDAGYYPSDYQGYHSRLQSADAPSSYVKKSPDAGYYPGSYYGYHSRYQYAYRPGLYLPGEGRIVSEKICRNPTIENVCRRNYEIIPGAIWTYTYFSYTEKQVAQARAERFARQHNGLVEHEGTAYVVYKDVLDCEFAVTACESLVKHDDTGDTASC